MQIAAVRLTEGVNEAICTRWLSCLPGKRQEEILRRQRPKDRERSLSGEILARAMLALSLIHISSSVRLACVRHAASVRPEPGSNSLKIVFNRPRGAFKSLEFLKSSISIH